MMYLIEVGSDKVLESKLIRLIMSSVLLISLSFALYVFSERLQFSNAKKTIYSFIGLALAVLYYFFLPFELEANDAILYMLLLLSSHLLVAFIPYLSREETAEHFWEFNKNLFLNFIVSAIYSAVLFGGLAIALLSIDNLLGIDVDEDVYPKLWFLVAGFFNTWYFVAQSSEHYRFDNVESNYPRGLKIFTQYVLLPIITVYLLILYAYIGKIFATSEWPVGWVSYLVLSFSIAGILALLLIWPTRNLEGNNWIKVYSKWFYLALFPLIVLLFFAIGIRIGDYGITEPRYFVLSLAIWLLINALYYLISKAKDIRFIPISLFLFALLSAFGPWSAFNVSKSSQMNRLLGLLEKNHMIKEGYVNPISDETKISKEDEEQISACVRYLVESHGKNSLRVLYSETGFAELDSGQLRRYQFSEQVVTNMGLKFRPYSYESEHSYEYVSWNGSDNGEINVSGYDRLVSFEMYKGNNELKSDEYRSAHNFTFNQHTNVLHVELSSGEKLQFEFSDFIGSKTLAKEFTIKSESTFFAEASDSSSNGLYTIGLTTVYGDVKNDKVDINSMNGYLLIRK